MKKVHTLTDRALDRLVRKGSASAAELICLDDPTCPEHSATYRVVGKRAFFYRCGC